LNNRENNLDYMEKKMSFENFNVLDYGADPSGKANSYQAFQDWGNAITAKGRGVGLVPPDTYKIVKETLRSYGSNDVLIYQRP
jgi:hypothetical protein